MAEIKDEIWVLLARYLCGEATPDECLLMEMVLHENDELKRFYQQLKADFLFNQQKESKEAFFAFANLDKRIKTQNPS